MYINILAIYVQALAFRQGLHNKSPFMFLIGVFFATDSMEIEITTHAPCH